MELEVGTRLVIMNIEGVRKEYRGQRCVIIESHPLFYQVKMETGETINRLVKLRKRNFGHNYKLYVKNKGGWIF